MPAMTVNIREGEQRDHDLMEHVESRRVVGDDRAPHLRRLLWDGVTVDDVLRDYGLEFDSPEDREAFIEQAICAYAETLDTSRSEPELPP